MSTASRWTVPPPQVGYFTTVSNNGRQLDFQHIYRLSTFTWEDREQTAWATIIQPFVAFSGEPGELLPGCLVTPRYSFRQTPHSIPEVGCQHAPVPLKCESSSPHQVVSELLRVKPEKRGPPAAPAWAWRSGEGWKILCRANKAGAKWAHTDLTRCNTCPKGFIRCSHGHLTIAENFCYGTGHMCNMGLSKVFILLTTLDIALHRWTKRNGLQRTLVYFFHEDCIMCVLE